MPISLPIFTIFSAYMPAYFNQNKCLNIRGLVITVASLQRLKMEALIPTPADCELRSVIKFLNAQSIAPIKIHHQLCQVYGSNVKSKEMVRRWCRQYTAGQQHVHDKERNGRPSIITDDLVELVREHIMENRRFTITDLSIHFP